VVPWTTHTGASSAVIGVRRSSFSSLIEWP